MSDRYALVPCGSGRPGCKCLILAADGEYVKYDPLQAEREAAHRMRALLLLAKLNPEERKCRDEILAAYDKAKGGAK